jgi:hypothetical protein
MQVFQIINGQPSIEPEFLYNRYFDTYTATIQHYGKYSAVSIDQQHHCCGKTGTIQRFIRTNADELHTEAINCTRTLNRESIMHFLRYRRRCVTLCSIFTIADSMGLILTRSLFESVKSEGILNPRHPFRKFPGVMRLSSDRFIACCKILEKYGALYSIGGGENYVSMARGI